MFCMRNDKLHPSPQYPFPSNWGSGACFRQKDVSWKNRWDGAKFRNRPSECHYASVDRRIFVDESDEDASRPTGCRVPAAMEHSVRLAHADQKKCFFDQIFAMWRVFSSFAANLALINRGDTFKLVGSIVLRMFSVLRCVARVNCVPKCLLVLWKTISKISRFCVRTLFFATICKWKIKWFV